MAEIVLKDARIYYKGHDLSGDINTGTVTRSVELHDRTCFGSSYRKRKAGLEDFELNVSGFWNSSSGKAGTTYGRADPVSWGAIGGSSDVVSVIPQGTGLGNPGMFTHGIAGEYTPGGEIGGLFGFNLVAYGQGAKICRGRLMEAGLLTTESADHIRNFGIASTEKNLYAAVHVFATSQSAAGASIKLKVQRSTTTDFSAVDSTVMTFTLTTADVGQGLWGSTKVESSGTNYSYRVHTSQLGSSGKKFNVAVMLSQQ